MKVLLVTITSLCKILKESQFIHMVNEGISASLSVESRAVFALSTLSFMFTPSFGANVKIMEFVYILLLPFSQTFLCKSEVPMKFYFQSLHQDTQACKGINWIGCRLTTKITWHQSLLVMAHILYKYISYSIYFCSTTLESRTVVTEQQRLSVWHFNMTQKIGAKYIVAKITMLMSDWGIVKCTTTYGCCDCDSFLFNASDIFAFIPITPP